MAMAACCSGTKRRLEIYFAGSGGTPLRPLTPIADDVVDHARADRLDIGDGLGEAAGRLARRGSRCCKVVSLGLPWSKLTAPRRLIIAVGTELGALDHQRDGGGLHLGDDIVVGAVELRDVLRLVRQARPVEEGVAGHVGAGAGPKGARRAARRDSAAGSCFADSES
jgi:hypothetical protein